LNFNKIAQLLGIQTSLIGYNVVQLIIFIVCMHVLLYEFMHFLPVLIIWFLKINL